MRLPSLPAIAAATIVRLCVGLAPASLAAQTVTGRVVDSATHRPLAHMAVRLVPATDSMRDTVYAVGESAADGVFLLLAPAPGRYRVRIGESHVGAPIVLAAVDAVDAHEYAVGATVPAPTPAPASVDSTDRVYSEKEVTTKARFLRSGEFPHPSESLRRRGTRGGNAAKFRATIECVVDTDGRCEPGTVRVRTTTDAEYGGMMRDYVASGRFFPARVGDRLVRQRAEVEFTLGIRTEVLRVPGP